MMESQILSTVQGQHGLATPIEPTDVEAFNKNYLPNGLPPTPLYEINERSLEVKLQFSRLEQSINAASLLDAQGFWNGGPDDETLRLDLQEISLRLQKMLTRPIDTIQSIAQAHHCEACLRYVVHNNVAEHVPLNGAISYTKLAAKTATDASQCKRILRLLTSQHVFAETPAGELSHTPASKQLLDSGVRAWVEYQTTDSLKSSTHFTEALTKWPGSLHKSETAYSLAHGTDLPMFEHFTEVGKIDRFRKAMSGNAQQPCFSPNHAIQGYPWQDLGASRDKEAALQNAPLVVDVGGGIGHVASALASTYPLLDIKVQDIGVTTSHSMNGIEFTAYNFFQPQPIKDADVYFMRQILHDWSDDYAVQILKNQISAMGLNSKLVIMDEVLQRPGDWLLSEERKSRLVSIAPF